VRYWYEAIEGGLLLMAALVLLSGPDPRMRATAPLVGAFGWSTVASFYTSLYAVHNHAVAASWLVVMPLCVALLVGRLMPTPARQHSWLLYGTVLSLLLVLAVPRWMTDILRHPLQDILLLLGLLPLGAVAWRTALGESALFGRRSPWLAVLSLVVGGHLVLTIRWHLLVWAHAAGTSREQRALFGASSQAVAMCLALAVLVIAWRSRSAGRVSLSPRSPDNS